MILLSLAGDVAKEAMKGLGVRFGGKLTERAVAQVPGRALVGKFAAIGIRCRHNQNPGGREWPSRRS